jgi:hypothetical protein
MPVHDWTRVDAGTFHDFHSAWIIHLKEVLNEQLVPEGYYALAEQHAGQVIADVLTLQAADETVPGRRGGAAAILAKPPPKVSRKVVAGPKATYRAARRTLTVRHVSGHRLIALIEILSPGNRDREKSVRDFVEKVHGALRHGCHLLVVDLFPPGRHDPQGIHEAIWADLDPVEARVAPTVKPSKLASYLADKLPEAHIETVAVGDPLPDMPLFLELDGYVSVPLEATYRAAYRGLPAYWRGVVEGRGPSTATGSPENP